MGPLLKQYNDESCVESCETVFRSVLLRFVNLYLNFRVFRFSYLMSDDVPKNINVHKIGTHVTHKIQPFDIDFKIFLLHMYPSTHIQNEIKCHNSPHTFANNTAIVIVAIEYWLYTDTFQVFSQQCILCNKTKTARHGMT